MAIKKIKKIRVQTFASDIYSATFTQRIEMPDERLVTLNKLRLIRVTFCENRQNQTNTGNFLSRKLLFDSKVSPLSDKKSNFAE
jgi:hypothetical protein